MNVAIVRGKFLNRYEMQTFEAIDRKQFSLTAFGSRTPYHDQFSFPVVKLSSPMDLPEFPYKMSVLNRLFVDAHYLWGLEERLKGFDIVHSAETYYHYTQQALDARRKGYVKKVIATVLENIPHNNEGIWGRKRFKRRSRNELDHMIALTKVTRDALITEGADPKKISVIGHGIDTLRFMPSPPRKSNEITVLFTGRQEEYKGVFDILDAAKILLSDVHIKKFKLKFLFVGEGSQYHKMLRREKEYGIESFVVHEKASYDDMPMWYQKADIFVAPSKSTKTWVEQYCTALLEAQASGLAIVTTRTGGIPENIGNAGIVVETGDVEAIANAIKKFLLNSNFRHEYAQKARRRAETVHDARRIADRIESVYRKVLGE